MGPAVSLEGRKLGEDFVVKDGFRMYHGEVVPGFPGHPHRGFETVTVVRKGLVDHSDSLGAAGRYGDGDVQWVTAGKGLQHSEMFPLLSREHDNPLELFQIWLNLPQKSKMVEPHFKMLWRENIPTVDVADAQQRITRIEVIAGRLNSTEPCSPPPDSWASDPDNEVVIWNIRMEAGATWTLLKASPGINRTLYYYEGTGLELNGTPIPDYSAVLLESYADVLLQAGEKATSILILQGRPIGEPVVQYGPFVMNSKLEIQQAFEDFQRTQFGGWPWPSYDHVHPREKGRFARHADGTLEEKV